MLASRLLSDELIERVSSDAFEMRQPAADSLGPPDEGQNKRESVFIVDKVILTGCPDWRH